MESKFAIRLRELLEKKRISKAQFTRDTGVSTPTLDKWLDGTLPNLSNALLIAKQYNVSLDWLCGIDEQKEVQNTSSFTDFDAQQYLISLAVFLSEIGISVKKSQLSDGEYLSDLVTIEILNGDLAHIIAQTSSLLDTYRNGTLPKEMYIACINMLIQKYSDFEYAFGNFVPKKDVTKMAEALNDRYNYNNYTVKAQKVGLHNISVEYDHYSVKEYFAFVTDDDLDFIDYYKK